MSSENKEIVQIRLAKAKETLHEVHILVENALWNAAVNRIYYSCFYAVSGLLLRKGIQSKTHSGVQQMFGLHFLKPAIIHEETGDFFSMLFHMRQKADYEDVINYEQDDVLPLLPLAQQLIDEVEKVLNAG